MNCKERKSYLLPCPICHEKTDVKIHEDTTLLYFPLQCSHCKQETLIHVVQLKMLFLCMVIRIVPIIWLQRNGINSPQNMILALNC